MSHQGRGRRDRGRGQSGHGHYVALAVASYYCIKEHSHHSVGVLLDAIVDLALVVGRLTAPILAVPAQVLLNVRLPVICIMPTLTHVPLVGDAVLGE